VHGVRREPGRRVEHGAAGAAHVGQARREHERKLEQHERRDEEAHRVHVLCVVRVRDMPHERVVDQLHHPDDADQAPRDGAVRQRPR